jgi:hypothetical protein
MFCTVSPRGVNSTLSMSLLHVSPTLAQHHPLSAPTFTARHPKTLKLRVKPNQRLAWRWRYSCYAILSHTWDAYAHELTFADLVNRIGKNSLAMKRLGFVKKDRPPRTTCNIFGFRHQCGLSLPNKRLDRTDSIFLSGLILAWRPKCSCCTVSDPESNTSPDSSELMVGSQ